MITLENGVKICIQEESLENCLEADANTTYANTLYNCTSCKFNYWPYYSGYYGRKICQNIFEPIIIMDYQSLKNFIQKRIPSYEHKTTFYESLSKLTKRNKIFTEICI